MKKRTFGWVQCRFWKIRVAEKVHLGGDYGQEGGRGRGRAPHPLHDFLFCSKKSAQLRGVGLPPLGGPWWTGCSPGNAGKNGLECYDGHRYGSGGAKAIMGVE